MQTIKGGSEPATKEDIKQLQISIIKSIKSFVVLFAISQLNDEQRNNPSPYINGVLQKFDEYYNML